MVAVLLPRVCWDREKNKLEQGTAQGSFCGKIGEGKHTVEATEDSIIVDGKEIKIYAVKDAKDAPWGELNVDVVLECTGFYTSKEKSMAHIQAGAKKVVISAPAGNDLKTIVFSVNEKTLTAEDQVISAASCTTNCLAPMADTLNKTYPIVSGIMTTVHAYTGDQMMHEKRNENSHAGKQVSAVGRGERLHHQQGCGHHRGIPGDRKSTRLNSSHFLLSRMPSSA